MTPADRVRKLVVEKRIGAEEGQRLLASLERAPGAIARLDPFVRLGGGIAAVIGVVGVVASLGVARLGVRFDGALDMHVHAAQIPTLRTALVDQGVAFVLPALAFWAYARSQSTHVRLVDFLGMIGLSRVPVIIGALPIVALAPPFDASALHLTPALVVVAFLSFMIVGSNITLLFFGFRNASGLTGKKLGIGFAAVLVATEILSKIALIFVH